MKTIFACHGCAHHMVERGHPGAIRTPEKDTHRHNSRCDVCGGTMEGSPSNVHGEVSRGRAFEEA